MSQRGGSVHIFIRIGKYYSPLFLQGESDYVLGLEPLETLRSLRYIGGRTVVFLNEEKINTVTTQLGIEKYPSLDYIKKQISKKCQKLYSVNAYSYVRKIGNPRGINIFMLGYFLGHTKIFSIEIVKEVIKNSVKSPLVNLRIFDFAFNLK